MSHSYGNGNSNGNNYLSKKRLDEDNQIDNRYHYEKYEKFEKYGSHSRYNNINYIHSKPSQGNNFYNTSSRYHSNYYNNPKPFYSNSYSNKLPKKKDYRKPYQKYTSTNTNEGIRNLSYCEMPSPPPSLKQKPDGDSLKSLSSTTAIDSKSSYTWSNNEINIKEVNKFVSNISNREKNDKDEEIATFKLPKPSEKFLNYEYFNRNSINLEENPLEKFEIYPKNLYEFNINNIPKKQGNTTISESINNDNIENILSIKSCYLLAKIPNWRLVTNFVPASSLTEENFGNILLLEQEKENEKRTEGFKLEKKNNEESQTENNKKEKSIKSHLVYFEGYEDAVEKYLEKNMSLKRNIMEDIFNERSIIEQYHYDILKIKNKLKQNIYKTKYLNIKQENLRNALYEKKKKKDESLIIS